MELKLRQSNLPAALPYSIEDQGECEGRKAIKLGTFVILSIDYELSVKELLDPDVDDIMSSVPNKNYLALVAGKAIANNWPYSCVQTIRPNIARWPSMLMKSLRS